MQALGNNRIASRAACTRTASRSTILRSASRSRSGVRGHARHSAIFAQANVNASRSSPARTMEQSTGVSHQAPVDDFAQDSRPVVLFDGVCNMCNAAVNLILDTDPEGRFRIAALQSNAGRRLLQHCKRAPDDITSVVLVESGGRHHIKSEAALRIATQLDQPMRFLGQFGLLLPLFIRDPIYDVIATNRYSIMGKRDMCRLRDKRFNERFLVD